MKNRYKRSLKKFSVEKDTSREHGITLVALVVTIVVLLILAGITITYVMGDNSVFKQAQNAKVQTEKAKAKERLEIVFNSLHLEKYAQKLTLNALDKRITEEVDKMDGEEIGDDKEEIIIDGYRFQVDRTVPKIEEELGPADGVIITASVSGNNGWIKPEEGLTLKGIIKTYSGGEITTSNATVIKGSTIISDFPAKGGAYTIEDIMEDTDITITATDSKGKAAERTVQIKVKRDTTKPKLNPITIEVKQMEIKFSATATDGESGVEELTYSITPTDGVETGKDKGTFQSGETVTISTTKEGTYTISVIAKDYVGNESEAQEAQATTIDGLTVEEAKQLVTSMNSLKENIGKKVVYKSGETWQIFYYDQEGEFGPENTLYLKKKPIATDLKTVTVSSKNSDTDPAVMMMKRMNPKWRDSIYSTIDLNDEKASVWLCDPEVWDTERNQTYSSFAIGAPSIEMYIKAYNVWKTGDKDSDNLVCGIGNKYGYYIGENGIYSGDNCSTSNESIEEGPLQIFGTNNWIASPAGMTACVDSVLGQYVYAARLAYKNIGRAQITDKWYSFSPVVPLDV